MATNNKDTNFPPPPFPPSPPPQLHKPAPVSKKQGREAIKKKSDSAPEEYQDSIELQTLTRKQPLQLNMQHTTTSEESREIRKAATGNHHEFLTELGDPKQR